jgi:HlyD family secretion protein
MSSARVMKTGLSAWLALAACTACTPPPSTAWQGYCEGEFVYVSAPVSGSLTQLVVTRGTQVAQGMPLFTLDPAPESSIRAEAEERLRQARARLEDLRKGQRPTELAALEARLAHNRTLTDLTARELERVAKLHAERVATDYEHDRARLSHQANTQLVAELEAQLATARLGGRSDIVQAAEAEAAAAQAALARADWALGQKSQTAPAAALVYDTLFREGEYVTAATPVLALLPPGNIKVRFFVPEPIFAGLKAGEIVHVHLSGRAAPLPARISYLAPRPEYTPPVLYNRDNRAKLVFMVEALPVDASAAADLHPGQPVEVSRP